MAILLNLDTARPVPFERGKVTVTLHFQRRSTGLFRLITTITTQDMWVEHDRTLRVLVSRRDMDLEVHSVVSSDQSEGHSRWESVL